MSNEDWLDRERKTLTAAAHRRHDPKFGSVFVRGEGSRLWCVEGLDYLDLTCGYSATNFGHLFPPLVQAATRQLSILSHVTQEPHPGRAELAAQLVDACGFGQQDGRVQFNVSGSRAVETAWKIAISHRPGQLWCLTPGYHGRSLATAALSETKMAIANFANPASLLRRPLSEFAYCAQCPLDTTYPGCQLSCQSPMLEAIERQAASISAVLVEPAIGARGYIFPPRDYWQRLREVTTQAGVLLIADEIQMGLGRAGAFLLSQSQGWQADLVILGKSLGGGITPISAVVGRGEVMQSLPSDVESETFACTPFAAAIALEVVKQLREGPWVKAGARIGRRLREHLTMPSNGVSAAFSVEGEGACAVVEFARRDLPLEAAQNQALRFAKACYHKRCLVHHSGPNATRVVLIPPLTMTDAELEDCLQRLTAAINE